MLQNRSGQPEAAAIRDGAEARGVAGQHGLHRCQRADPGEHLLLHCEVLDDRLDHEVRALCRLGQVVGQVSRSQAAAASVAGIRPRSTIRSIRCVELGSGPVQGGRRRVVQGGLDPGEGAKPRSATPWRRRRAGRPGATSARLPPLERGLPALLRGRRRLPRPCRRACRARTGRGARSRARCEGRRQPLRRPPASPSRTATGPLASTSSATRRAAPPAARPPLRDGRDKPQR